MQPVIAIVGAGIGGLTTALAFARQGVVVNIFEQSEQLREVGAGIQLSPNATAILGDLGLTDALAEHWHEPDGISLMSGASLRTLTSIPLGSIARQRWHSPYAVIHRPDLLQTLSAALSNHADCNLFFNTSVPAVPEEQTCDALQAISGNRPDLIVFADGVWSRKRDSLPGSSPATFSGHVAWRTTTTNTELPELFPQGYIGTFLGPACHLVCYPLGNSGAVNLIAATPGDPSRKQWDETGDLNVLIDHFKRWNPKIVDALNNASWRVWPLYEARNSAWQDGSRTVLIGDAAHAMSPHAAQGAAMAIEDGVELAYCFSRSNGDTANAISNYVATRQPRVDRVRRRGDLNKFAYHARGPIRIARDLTFKLRGAQHLAADMDWLYGYRAGEG
ncbi:MAG: FAD-dependent monooxygenase [Alphaproteobacteria bacterium]|nr:FAD-dependent monooxygenase [Alphaproteobacteria bacterium]